MVDSQRKNQTAKPLKQGKQTNKNNKIKNISSEAVEFQS
jgi:hypothetical protein